MLDGHYRLIPPHGWECFSRHIALSDFIYDHLMPIVNSGRFQYLNLFNGCGVFEDDCDNSIFILFDESKRKEEFVEIRVSESLMPHQQGKPSELLLLVETMMQQFNLEKFQIK